MRFRKVTAGVMALTVAMGGGAVALGATAPKRTTIKQSAGVSFKPNRYLKDELRWNKDVYHVRSGGTLHVVASVLSDGPHTFTVVRKRDLPTTARQLFTCKVCAKLGAAHGADPNSPAPPKFLFLENGKGQDTPPNVNGPGDSAAVGFSKDDASVDLKVTARKGAVLRFLCLIHPWMQAKVVVG